MDGFCTHHAIFPLDLLTWSQQWRKGTVSCDIYGIQVVYFSQNLEFKCVSWNQVCIERIKFAFCGIQVCIVRIKFSFCRIQVCVFENSSLRFGEFKFTFLRIQVYVFENSSLRFVEFKFASKESSLRF